MKIECVGVVGSGVMGRSVALDLASHSYKVVLNDINDEILEDAKKAIIDDFKMLRFMGKRMPVQDIDTILKNIEFTTGFQSFSKAQFVVENITENWSAKEKVYCKLSKVCSENTIYGVNTSCISITRIGSLMSHPDRVIGTHFMNPVPLKKMVEVIKGYYTSEETIDITKRFLSSFDKKSIIVNDAPGFVTNRVLMLMINECIWTIHDKVTTPKEMDRIFREGFGHKMGPLATADLIGLDTILNSILVLYNEYKDSKYRPCPLLIKMVDAGLLGKKSGKGFFEYE